LGKLLNGSGAEMSIESLSTRRLLQAVYKPVVASPEFKERLLKRLLREVARRELRAKSQY